MAQTMDPQEQARWLDGRRDWQDGAWQDHCGAIECPHCDALIPLGHPQLQDARAKAFKRGWPLPDPAPRFAEPPQ